MNNSRKWGVQSRSYNFRRFPSFKRIKNIVSCRHCLAVCLVFRTVNFFNIPLWPGGGLVAPQTGILNLNVDCKDECYICYCPWAIMGEKKN